MPGNDYFLWAGLFLILFELFHFSYQRKLNDQRTFLLYAMMICSMLICISGIVLTYFIRHRLFYTAPAIFMSTLLYLSQLTLPYLLLCMICMICSIYNTNLRTPVFIGLFLFILGAIFTLTNPLSGLIFHPESDGLLHIGRGYRFFVCGIMLWYAVDFLFIFLHYKKLNLRQLAALCEVSVFLLLGMLVQNILRLQLLVGFTSALAILALYISLNSPYAYIDHVTRVFNPDYFQRWITERFWYNRPTSIIIVNFTQLEHIRTVYDFHTGNTLLKEVTKMLWHKTPSHAVFRLKFNQYLLCTNTTYQQELLLADLQETFDTDFSIDGHKINCPASFYTITDIFTCNNADSLLAYIHFLIRQPVSDNQILPTSEALYQTFSYEQEVERYLNIAVENNLFEVWYQPIYNIKESCFVAFEALSRLKHPELGWISPELFFRIAGNTDLIFQILPLQLRKICKFVRENSEILKSIDNIKINLSPAELTRPGYCDALVAIIREFQLPTSRFQFEVTETTATKYSDELSDCILRLQSIGINLCLDDFGSGYANLNSILRLPFSVIKMDRSLLRNIDSDNAARTFYQNMVRTLKDTGYQIVAEGVETKEEATLMALWNVDMIQGYFYAKPMPGQDILCFLDAQNHEQEVIPCK